MTAGAGPAADRNSRMAKRSTGKRSRRRVTGLTGSSGREMVRRLGDDATDPIHAARMATGTTGCDPRMSHRSSRPKRGRIVASFAPCRSWEMGRRLSDDTADEPHSGRMARGTASGNTTVIHQGPAERNCGSMAGLTSGRGKR